NDITQKPATRAAGESKTPNASVAETRSIPMKTEKIPLAAAPAEKPALAPAAASPETLAYVRSALDKKDAGGTAQTAQADSEPETLASIEPTSGAAISAGASIKPGSSYVQLASIG